VETDPKTLVFNGDDALVHEKLCASGKRANNQETTSESCVLSSVAESLSNHDSYLESKLLGTMIVHLRGYYVKIYTIKLFVIVVISDQRDTDITYLHVGKPNFFFAIFLSVVVRRVRIYPRRKALSIGW
jgi:hypothetical protein